MEQYNFREITIGDREWIQARLAEDDDKSCERSFSTIFLYRRLYQAQMADIKGCCVLRFMYKTMRENVPYWTYYFPIGAGDKRGALEVMLELCRRDNIPLHMEPISPKERELLLDWFPGTFRIESHRDCYDYVYSREKLASLKGKKMQKKRNHIARFKDDPDWSYEPITKENLAETRFMAHNWICSREEKWNEDMENEFSVLEDAFANYEALGLRGGILRQHGDIVAFTMGEPLNSNTFLVHFEKAFPEVQGAYPMINQQFVQAATEGYEYINREDDTGDLGLRKAKLSYYPEILLKKYVAETSDVVLADPIRDKEAVSEIWRQCFGDSQEFIDFYIENRMTELNMLVIRRDGRPVSMASFLPTDIQTPMGNLEGYYVYAVATLPEYQGQGLSGRILAFAQEHWQKPLLLSPAESHLRIFYAKRGFQPVYVKKFYALQPREGNSLGCVKDALEDKRLCGCDGSSRLAGVEGAAEEESSPVSQVELKAATAKEYKAIRDEHWQGPGYVAWLTEDIEYAMKHAAFQEGESLVFETPEGKQLVMYVIDGDTMHIVETTLGLCQLPELLPVLKARFEELHPDHEPLRNYEYRLPDGMVWLPEQLKTTRLKRKGYFNLALD